MPKIVYTNRNFTPNSLAIISAANSIIAEYSVQGFDLTLRQLYYQFVSRGFIPNRDTEYHRLGSVVNDARMAGMIDWEAIVDRTRNLRKLADWDTPAELIDTAARQYRNDLWKNQPVRVEVWIEKDALVGVIEGICNEYGIPHFSCRGYTSASEMWVAAQRHLSYIEAGQRVLILHLGDHDPSGIDMTRDIEERLYTFILTDFWRAHRADIPDDGTSIASHMDASVGGEAFDVRRIALNWEQVQQHQPPPNPAKLTDSRAKDYISEWGSESWELDALDPATLADLIRTEVENEIRHDQWVEDLDNQRIGKDLLMKASDRWEDVAELLGETI